MPDNRDNRSLPPRKHMPSRPELPKAPTTPVPPSSFGTLDENDRALLQRVLLASQNALERTEQAVEREERARIALEGELKANIGDVREDVTELKGAVTELRGVAGDLRNLNGSINTLNGNVMSVLQRDTDQERRLGEMRLEMERLAHSEGSKAGAKWGTISATAVSLLTGVVYIVLYAMSVVKGVEPPKPPQLPGTAPTHAAAH